MTMRTLSLAPRFLDVEQEPLIGESIVDDFGKQPIVSLEEAIKHIQPITNHYEDMVRVAKSKMCYSADHLTKDEAAAICLYTMKHLKTDQDVSVQMNRALRYGIQADLIRWIPYLQLFVNGLNKLPSKQGRIWRCAQGDVTADYQNECVWLGFSSCTETELVAEDFIDKYSSYTIFVIDCINGKAIRNYSDHPWEDEVLLMPGTRLRVLNKESRENGIKLVYLQEEPSYNHPFSWPLRYPSSINRTYQSEYTLSSTATQSNVEHSPTRLYNIDTSLLSQPKVEYQTNHSVPSSTHVNVVYIPYVEKTTTYSENENVEQKKGYSLYKDWLNYYYYNDNRRSIMTLADLERKLEDPPRILDAAVLNRVKGSMFGMAVGDALGAHVEFRSRHHLAEHPVEDLRDGGTWGLGKGQFTGDTSMGLCLAASLIVHGDFAPYDQLVRYKWWFRHGYMSSTGHCFDIGKLTYESLLEFERRQQLFSAKYGIPSDQLDTLTDTELLTKFNVLCGDVNSAGNEALMRLAPVPLFFYRYPIDAIEFSGMSGVLTQGNLKVYDACRYYGALIVAALRGETKAQLLDDNFYINHYSWFNNKPLCPEVMQVAQGSYKRVGGYRDGIRGKGYIISSLEAALWAFYYDDNSFERGVLSAVNLGDDTDTTAAIYGQLAGAYYDFSRLPDKWTRQIYKRDVITCFSKWIVYEGERWQPNIISRAYLDNLIMPTRILNTKEPIKSVHTHTTVTTNIWLPRASRTPEPTYSLELPSYDKHRSTSPIKFTSTTKLKRPIPTRYGSGILSSRRHLRSSVDDDLLDYVYSRPRRYDYRERFQELRDGAYFRPSYYIRRYPSDPLI